MAEQTTHEERSVTQGVDMDAHDEFLAFAEENPEAVQFGLSAEGAYEGRAIHTRAKTQSYTLGGDDIDRLAREYTSHFGGHKEVEEAVGFVDPTDRQEVIETALASLSGCLNAALSMSALQAGIELDELTTTVRIEWDPFIFLGLEDIVDADGTPKDMFGDLEIDIEVAGEDVDEDTLAQLKEWTGRSAVYNLMTLAHDADPQVTLTNTEAVMD